jgi:transaldolase/glucose-6-phosphate isomerase
MGDDLPRLLLRTEEMVEACRLEEGNPGRELGERLGTGWRDGRDKLLLNGNPAGFGLWVEQLIAESTGKEGKGLVPAPDEPGDGPDRQREEIRVTDPYELGQEFYRWEFATAVAGALLGINPFDQPDVQAAKDRTTAILEQGGEVPLDPEGSVDDLLAQAGEGDYVAVLAFVDPAAERRLEPLVARARKTGCVVTVGLGPRYLHSTGQLHKGGPNTGVFVQVVDDLGDDLPIPGRDFGFRRLIAAQAAGDFEALRERGRRVARVRLEDLE